MIFYGRRASKIKDGRLSNISCPDCSAQTSYTYSIYGKYAHVYWIPLFPMGKEFVLECNNCKRTYKAKDLPENIQHKFNNEKQSAKTPIWNFAGLAVIAGLISLGIYWNGIDKDNEVKYINDPKVGDVYSSIGSTSNLFVAMKVTEVTTDSVHVIYSDYEVDMKSAIDEIDKAEFYTDQTDSFSRTDVIYLYEEKIIYNIDRD